MKFKTLFLKDTCQGRSSGQGHTLSVGPYVKEMTFDAGLQMFRIDLVQYPEPDYVPASNIRNAIALVTESNEKQKGK
jgi:hypothetical protein